MSKYLVVVADTQRARFFTLQDSLTPEVESSPRLVEEQNLLNSEGSKSGIKARGASASGSNHSGSGGVYAFDNHQNKRALDELRRFNVIVMKEALKQAKKASAHTLIFVAGRKTLGVIREGVANITQKGLDILDCNLEITGEIPSKIHALLARRKLVPAMKRPSLKVRR